MYTAKIDELRQELNRLWEEGAPYDIILEKSQELDPYVVAQQRLLIEQGRGRTHEPSDGGTTA